MPFLKGGTVLVDTNLILRKITQLERYLSQVMEFSDLTIQGYKADWKTQRIVERTLQMMIETCTDIANHIISDTNSRPPATYADTFSVLLENGIISSELSGSMEKMVKFRNIIVHQYEEVDAEIVVVILQKHLADFKEFKEAVLGYLRGHKA